MNKSLLDEHVAKMKELQDAANFFKERIALMEIKRQRGISGSGLKSLSVEKAIDNLEKLQTRLKTALKNSENGSFEHYSKLYDWVEANERQIKALKKSQRQRVNVYEFSYELIDAIKERVSIPDMLKELKIRLKRSGADKYVICCPFHDEDTPSCMIYVHEDKYHCYGCGVHGDVIDFYQNYLDIEFDEALTRLCERLGVQVVDAEQIASADTFIAKYRESLEEAEKAMREERLNFTRRTRG